MAPQPRHLQPRHLQPRHLQPGQESVWDYPRPPRLESVAARLQVVHAGVTVADTTAGLRVLETSHPPNYYFPPEDVDASAIERTTNRSFCEFKGVASYWSVHVDGATETDVAWGYLEPSPGFESLTGRLAFYASRMDECWVGDERATAQPGGFYGGWVTEAIVGPIKGGPGTSRW